MKNLRPSWEDSAELLGLISLTNGEMFKVKARATVLELAAAAGWPAVKKVSTFIDGCRDGVSTTTAMVADARGSSSWMACPDARKQSLHKCALSGYGGIAP